MKGSHKRYHKSGRWDEGVVESVGAIVWLSADTILVTISQWLKANKQALVFILKEKFLVLIRQKFSPIIERVDMDEN